MERALSSAMRRLICDCARWGEIGPDAEDAAGCHGAAFDRVVYALITRGLLEKDGGITAAGRAAAIHPNKDA